MELLKLPRNIYEYYIKEVRDSENDSYHTVRKKLTRNAELSEMMQTEQGDGIYYAYGRLHFIVASNNMIVWMKNHCSVMNGWEKDEKRYHELNEELGIESQCSVSHS